jgi:hypothetical protein
MASTWAATANNETISFNNLQNGVDTGVLSQKAAIPVSNEQITKADANIYVNINTSFAPYAAKASNQLVVKSNLQSTPSINYFTTNRDLLGISNNQSTSTPIGLVCGYQTVGSLQGEMYRSTNYGLTYSNVLSISDRLNKVKFMPAFRHASYLSVPPFVSVGINGRIITNSNTDATSWINISSPTTQDLYDIAFNSSVGIIVGQNRIIKTNTNNRINSWSIVNSVTALWRAVSSNGSTFIAVGDNSAIITGNSLGTTWTVRTLPAPLTLKDLRGVTYHTDGFWYAVGFDSANPSQHWIMRSSDDGINWSQYVTTGDSLISRLNNINSIGDRLVISGDSAQYQIINNVVTKYETSGYIWYDNVKDANSNGFDMAGVLVGFGGAVSNF